MPRTLEKIHVSASCKVHMHYNTELYLEISRNMKQAFQVISHNTYRSASN